MAFAEAGAVTAESSVSATPKRKTEAVGYVFGHFSIVRTELPLISDRKKGVVGLCLRYTGLREGDVRLLMIPFRIVEALRHVTSRTKPGISARGRVLSSVCNVSKVFRIRW